MRDESLPMSTRVAGLRGCLRHYKPIGFEASSSFLNSLAGNAKSLGHRVPHPSAPNPNRPSHWYGAPREAAFHAVWFWYSKGASDDVDVHSLAAALVHRGRFTAVQREMLLEVRPKSWDSQAVLRQMAVVAGEVR